MTRPLASVKRANEPRYLTIVRQIERDIAREHIAVGEHLPSELVLCRRLGVSRFTVRQAIRHLSDSGMVVARRGSGTVVTARTPSRSFIHAVESLDDLNQYAKTTRFEVGAFERVVAGVALARRLGCRRGQDWWRTEGYRYDNSDAGAEVPICWTEAFVAEEFTRIGELSGSANARIFHFLEAEYGERVLEVTQTLRAVLVPANIAPVLAVEPGSPALEVDRVYRSARGKVVEIASSIHPADRFSYTMRLWRDVKR
jgi:DNA-binding GntR family transcriptional regulator